MAPGIERVKTGVFGLDDLLEGGFPKGRTILIAGACGTGKTILGMQYAYKGASENNEPAVYVTVDEIPARIREDMARFGWDLEKLESQNKLAIMDIGAAKVGLPSEEKYTMQYVGLDVDKMVAKIIQTIEQIGAKRLVIDSVSSLGLHINDENEIRKFILKLNYMLAKHGVTTLMMSEVDEQDPRSGVLHFSKYNVEEYAADGVIAMHFFPGAQENWRTIFIRKMRGTKHYEDIVPFEFTPKGIGIKKTEF